MLRRTRIVTVVGSLGKTTTKRALDAALDCPDRHAYRRAIEADVPSRYAGRVVLLRASEAGGEGDSGWRRVTDRLAAHVVPGDHLTCLTTHAAALAERLHACLDDAHRERSR